MGTSPPIPPRRNLQRRRSYSMVIQLRPSLQKMRTLAWDKRASHLLNTMAHQHQRPKHRSSHSRRMVINRNITTDPIRGAMSRSEVPQLQFWRIDCHHQKAMHRQANMSAVLHATETWSWCNLIPCATIWYCKRVLFPSLFMSGFQRLSLICVAALEVWKSVSCEDTRCRLE